MTQKDDLPVQLHASASRSIIVHQIGGFLVTGPFPRRPYDRPESFFVTKRGQRPRKACFLCHRTSAQSLTMRYLVRPWNFAMREQGCLLCTAYKYVRFQRWDVQYPTSSEVITSPCFPQLHRLLAPQMSGNVFHIVRTRIPAYDRESGTYGRAVYQSLSVTVQHPAWVWHPGEDSH